MQGWPLGRAEAVARAFTVYFHLANLAEEHQRIRTLRERDTGAEPVRESLAAAIASLRHTQLGTGHQDTLIGRLEVHPVLTAHPTEARRRAVTESLRRISALLVTLDGGQPGAAAAAEATRRLREEIDLLWRTSPLRSRAMQPLDEVRSGMAVFDDTLFRLAPAVYRALDQALQGEASGVRRARAPAFLRYGSWIGADRDGNPFVTAAVTEQAARIQADHALRALENATVRIGRSLTVDADLSGGPVLGQLGPGRRHGGRGARGRARGRRRQASRRCSASSARTPPVSHSARSCCTRRSGCWRPGSARTGRPAVPPARPSSWPTCGWRSARSPRSARPGRRTASCST